MSNKNESKNDPILNISTKNMKDDILLFKNEALKDFKEAQKKVSQKYNNLDLEIKEKLNSYESRIKVYETKISELSKLINTDKTIREKVDKLMEFKEKTDESMLTEKIRLDNCRNDLNANVNRIDQILKESVIYPGIIGGISKYKTFHDLIDYVLTQCSQNLTFREKSIIDLKSYKTKLDNIISSFNTQINTLLNTTSEFTKTCVKECEDRMKSIYNIYDDRLQDARIENANYAIGLEKATDVLKKELENLYVVKNELYEKVDKGIEEVKNDNKRVIKLFAGYKKGFNLLQYKFTQLSDFIKDIRFRINMKEDVNRREYTHMSDMINFDKKKKGFMDGINNLNFLKKGLASQIKDYIEGKITADELLKRKDRSNRLQNNLNVSNEIVKRKSLSDINNINFTEGINLNALETMRTSMALPKKSLSLENDLIKNTKVNIKKEEIKEEDEEDNDSSKDIISAFKKNQVKETNQVKEKKEILDEDLYEDRKIEKSEEKNNINKTIKKENSKIQIISKDKEKEKDKEKDKEKEKVEAQSSKTKPRASLKNVIKDIFGVKNIIDSIKKTPNKSETKVNKNDKIIIDSSNNTNSNIKNKNSSQNEFYKEKKNEINKISNNPSSTALNFRNKNMSEPNLTNQNWNPIIKKLEPKIDNNKNNNRENIRLISGDIKKKLINVNFNSKINTMMNNTNSYKKLNNVVKEKNKSYSKKPGASNKSYHGLKKDENKTAGEIFINKFLDKNDINMVESKFMIVKKKKH